MTECSRQRLLFQPHGGREVTAAFDGGRITSDGGGLLLREVEERFGIVRSFVGCFTDHRDPELVEFRVGELLLQRVMGLALGDEDLNDHDAATGGLIETVTLPAGPRDGFLKGTRTIRPRRVA